MINSKDLNLLKSSEELMQSESTKVIMLKTAQDMVTAELCKMYHELKSIIYLLKKFMIKYKLIFFLIFLHGSAIAQTSSCVRLNSFGGPGIDRVRSIATDGNGNVYTTGYFSATADFDPGPGVHSITSHGFGDIFILKLDSAGNFIWVKTFGDSFDDAGCAVECDQSGNIYVAGEFKNSVDFDPDTGTWILSGSGKQDVFILKLDADGNLDWATRYSNAGGDSHANDLLVENSNLFVTGYFRSQSGNDQGFINKIDTGTGNILYSNNITGGGNLFCNALATDNATNIYVTGYFQGKLDFNSSTTDTFFLATNGSYAAFILKMNDAGDFLRADAMIDSMGFARSNSIAVNQTDNSLYITGRFNGRMDFDPDTSATFIMNSNTSSEIFISKFDSAGYFIWAKRMEQTASLVNSEANSLVLDSLGNLFISGGFNGSVDFDPDSSTHVLASMGLDAFISKYDESGNYLWSEQSFGGYREQGKCLAISHGGNILMAGDFESDSLVFDLLVRNNSDSTLGNSDLFIAEFYISNMTGINNWNTQENLVNLYPNPASNYFSIAFEKTTRTIIEIFNVSSTLIYSENFSSNYINMNIQFLPVGLYFVHFNSNEFSIVKKLMVIR